MNKEDKIISLMEEIVRLQRISVKPVFKKLVEETLDKPEKLITYELTGENSRDQIIAQTGMGAGTISSWWVEWFSKGLLEKDGIKYKKIFSLSEIGITIPRKFKNTLIEKPVENPEEHNVEGENNNGN